MPRGNEPIKWVCKCDYVRRYLGSGIRSLGSWNRAMESGLRGKMRDRYHFGHVERGPQILTPGAQV